MSNQKPVKAKSFSELRRGITPLIPGQPEMIPWVWFDTVSYTSGSTTTLTMFSTVQTDKVLGNMEAAGQIPSPMFFDLYHLGLHFHIAPSVTNTASATGVNTGAINDSYLLSTGEIEIVVAQKTYFKDKIYACPSGAGIIGSFGAAGTYTAQASSLWQSGVNGWPTLRNRNNFWGMLTIPHNQTFSVILNWTSALTLAGGNTSISCRLDGFLYRRVL